MIRTAANRCPFGETFAGLSLGACLALGACDSDREKRAPTTGISTTAPAAPELTGRREFLARQNGRCTLYWTNGQRVGSETPTDCPREIEDGERLELTGKTCMRHSTDPGRRRPTRCPSAMLELPSPPPETEKR